jgi:hypothetical protein
MEISNVIRDHIIDDVDLPQNAITVYGVNEHKQSQSFSTYIVDWQDGDHNSWTQHINFQDGPIKEYGVNGLTNEILLAIVKHRLEGFQSGEFPCEDNQEAISHISKAISALQRRTIERVDRGVEGYSLK